MRSSVMSNSIRILAAAGMAVLAWSGAAQAQDVEFGGGVVPTRFRLSGGVIVAQPVREFRSYVGTGYGGAAQLLYALDRQGWLSVRLEGGALQYGSETRRVCFSGTVGCRIQVDLTTSNSIAFLNVGPHLELPVGPVRPFVNVGVGGSHFSTTSSLKNITNQEDIASTSNFSDGTLAWSGGGGLNVMVSGGAQPVALQLAARYHGNGSVQYLREGDIQDHPDGTISFTPNRSEANLVTWQIGVSVGVGRGM
jgi:opacity protein-like surface antigen